MVGQYSTGQGRLIANHGNTEDTEVALPSQRRTLSLVAH